jgi:hypothetical protein
VRLSGVNTDRWKITRSLAGHRRNRRLADRLAPYSAQPALGLGYELSDCR